MEKIDFSVTVTRLDGEPFKFDDKPFTMGFAAYRGLVANTQETMKLDLSELAKRYELAKKVKDGGEVEIDADEAVLIRESLKNAWGIEVIGFILERIK